MSDPQAIVVYSPIENIIFNGMVPSLVTPGGWFQGFFIGCVVLISLLLLTDKFIPRSIARKYPYLIMWTCVTIGCVVWFTWCKYI